MYPELMTNDKALSPLMGLLKIDQLAFLARSDEDEAAIKKQLRLTNANWVEDYVVAEGYVRGGRKAGDLRGQPSRNTAKLMFNYDMGVEIEILRYTEGHNYADEAGIKSCTLCHIGAHVNKGSSINELPPALHHFVFASPIIQEVLTKSHTNEFLLTTGRRYKYTIYDTLPLLGVFMKVIERIEA